MQHLDEGLLMALLDGELRGSEQHDAETHLRACTECSARFDELKGLMTEADGLVVALGEPPAPSARTAGSDQSLTPASRRISPRTLAWAASIIAALGLGFAGSTLMSSRDTSGLETRLSERADQPPSSSAPGSPSAPPGPSEVALQEERNPEPSRQSAATAPGRADESERNEADRTNQPGDEAPAVRPNAVEPGQATVLSQDRDLANAAAGRDTTAPVASGEVTAKMADLARAREGRADGFAAAAPAGGGLRRERAQSPVFERVTMEEAVRHLSGAIRLIDGLTPEEFEVTALDSAHPVVRVLYRVGPAESRLFLEQRRIDKSFVASDLQVLEPVVERTQAGNRLSWKDLRGFSLVLFGPIHPDSLFHFKTLVK